MISSKFLLTGTISVGKSATLEYLGSLNLPGIGFVKEVARDLIDSAPDLAISTNKPGVLPDMGSIIFEEQKRREIECAKLGSRIILCDRGSLDIITHARALGGEIKSEWEDWVNSYNLIFYFNKEGIPFNPDSYPKGMNWELFRDALDRETRLFLASCNVSHKELLGTVQQRAETIRSYFNEQHRTPEGNLTPYKERL